MARLDIMCDLTHIYRVHTDVEADISAVRSLSTQWMPHVNVVYISVTVKSRNHRFLFAAALFLPSTHAVIIVRGCGFLHSTVL